MGLNLEVGILGDLKTMDPEGFAFYQEEFRSLNSFLVTKGLPEHLEPEECAGYGAEMWSYSGLHYLRRIAILLDLSGKLPSPGSPEALDEKDYLRQRDEYYVEPDLFSRLIGRRSKRRFRHLCFHSDCEGYYLPIDFAEVLFPPDELKIAGTMVGSTNRLQAECRVLKEALQIPDGLMRDSDEVWSAPDDQGTGDVLWRRYGVESLSCLGLLEACEASLSTGAAIIFT